MPAKTQELKSRQEKLVTELEMLCSVQLSFQTKIARTKKRLEKVEGYEILVAKAAEVLDYLADQHEKRSKGAVEDLISYGLQAIFDENAKFNITLETKARAVHAYFGLGEEKQDLIKSKGGGYIDLISVMMVLTLLLKEQPAMRRFIVLDESFAEVGRHHLERVGEFLKFLTQKLGVTILLITHSKELLEFADVIYDVSKPGDFTVFKRRGKGEVV